MPIVLRSEQNVVSTAHLICSNPQDFVNCQCTRRRNFKNILTEYKFLLNLKYVIMFNNYIPFCLCNGIDNITILNA